MKKKNTNYKPIDCNLYDELVLLIMRKKKVKILFENEEKEETEINTILKDIFSKEGEEFILLKSGANIRLDKLRKIDGEEFEGYCQIK